LKNTAPRSLEEPKKKILRINHKVPKGEVRMGETKGKKATG